MRAWRTDALILLVVLAVFIGGNIWIARRGMHAASGIDILPNPSAFNGGPSGLRGLYFLWRELGFDTRVWRRGWEDLPSEAGVLVVAAPFALGADPEEEESSYLLKWAEAGHSVLLIGRDTDVSKAFGLRPVPGSSKPGTLRPLAPTDLLTGVDTLRLGGDRWADLNPSIVSHVGDDDGPALVSCSVGDSRLIALADASALSNEYLREADNAILAANLAAIGSVQGPIYFDEFHHGFRERRTLAALLFRPPLLWVTLQVLLALALLLHAASRRFGTPVPLVPAVRHRASVEYVTAMASLYRRGKAVDLMLERLSKGFRREVSRSLGLPANAPAQRVAEAAAARSGVEAARIVRVLGLCEEQVAPEARPKESLLLWAGVEIETLRRKILGG
jgi:hypothetical protein